APVFDGADVPPGPPTGHHPIRFDEGFVARLTAFANGQNGTLFMCLLTGLKALLLARTGRSDICVATAMANRTQADTERIVGPFENTVIVRTRIEPELSFAQAFARVRQSVLDAHARQEVPSDILAERLRDESIDPAALTQIYFTLQNPLRQPIDLP